MSTLYAYTARSSEGRFVAGSMQAESLEHVLAHLRTRSLFITSLEPRSSARGLAAAAFTLRPVSANARLAFFRALATLVRSGVPLRRSLEVTIERCSDGRLSEALQAMASDIESGTSLSVAMARRPAEFPILFTSMIRAGELGGVLDEVLERLATMLELERSMRKRLAAALAYPSIVSAAAIALILFLVANIVPAFSGMFAQMHVPIPLSTRILIRVGDALRTPVILASLLLLACIAIGAFRFASTRPMLAPAFDGIRLALPVVGSLLRKVITARFSRTLGTLLRSGVTLLEALEACEEVVGSVLYSAVIKTVGKDLREGHPVVVPLEESKMFDPIFLQLVRVGEETGTLDAMLLRVAEYFEVDIETSITALGSIVEPVLIIVLGSIVGMIVACVLIPLYSIIGSIK